MYTFHKREESRQQRYYCWQIYLMEESVLSTVSYCHLTYHHYYFTL
jgi:hypothetical protein